MHRFTNHIKYLCPELEQDTEVRGAQAFSSETFLLSRGSQRCPMCSSAQMLSTEEKAKTMSRVQVRMRISMEMSSKWLNHSARAEITTTVHFHLTVPLQLYCCSERDKAAKRGHAVTVDISAWWQECGELLGKPGWTLQFLPALLPTQSQQKQGSARPSSCIIMHALTCIMVNE